MLVFLDITIASTQKYIVAFHPGVFQGIIFVLSSEKAVGQESCYPMYLIISPLIYQSLNKGNR